MNQSRLEQLIRFYTEDPTDPFLLYGLALEYQKTDLGKSEQLFEKALKDFPNYLPTYYHAGKLKAELSKIEEAKLIFLKGIELAKELKQPTTLKELVSARNELIWDES